MKKVAFRNLGCKVNEYEIEHMQQRMAEKGYFIVPFDAKADIYVINTCTVTNIADRKSRQMLHRAKKENPEAIVVAVGCYVQSDPEKAAKDQAVDIIIGNNQKSKIADIIDEYFENHAVSIETVSDLTKPVEYEEMQIDHTEEHTRAFIKIQDGCNQFCSYCEIPIVRGRIRSRSLESILTECRNLADNGYSEVVLTGIHLSSYGLDGTGISYNEAAKDGAFTNKALLEVITEVSKIDGIKRIRLGSLEPRLITEEFLKILTKVDKICPHFHLSLQSGSNETLKRMNRHYTTAEYANSVKLLRMYFDDPAITTDVIVGFPQETQEEFEESCEFVKEMGFFELHVFKYSRRKGTVADKMAGQIPENVKDERSEKLITIGNKLSDEFRKRYEGRQVEVLFEEKKGTSMVGHTREYIMVGTLSDDVKRGQIAAMKINGESLYFL